LKITFLIPKYNKRTILTIDVVAILLSIGSNTHTQRRKRKYQKVGFKVSKVKKYLPSISAFPPIMHVS
jgi:hypothetical protein